MKTLNILHAHNTALALGLIDNLPPEARGCVDPHDPIFNEPLTAPISVLNREV